MWLSGDSTNLVSWNTNSGGSSPSIGSKEKKRYEKENEIQETIRGLHRRKVASLDDYIQCARNSVGRVAGF